MFREKEGQHRAGSRESKDKEERKALVFTEVRIRKLQEAADSSFDENLDGVGNSDGDV